MAKVRLDDLIDGIRTAHPDRPLDQLTSAVLTAQHLADVADHLIGHFVDRARHSGASWSEIGECLGVTKQAAQQRFTPKANEMMFSRFTERARAALFGSMEEARAGNYSEIEPAHIAIAVAAAPDSFATRMLADQGVSATAVRAALQSQAVAPADSPEPPAMIPYSAASKKVIELSVREAVRLGHNYVGTEHMLLALLAANPETPSVLADLNIDVAAAEAFLVSALASIAPSGQATDIP
jgi:Clp amino terminal domain, pathogenicity island component